MPTGGTVISGTAQQEGQVGVLFSRTPAKLPDGDREKAKWIWGLLQKAKQWKYATGFGESQENWDFWTGKQWIRQRAQSLSMAVINIVFSTVETFIGHVVDNIPESIARARKRKYEKTGQLITKLVNWADDINDLKSSMELYLRSAWVSGFAVKRVDWDERKGIPSYSFVDENSFFLAPWTRNPDLSDCRYTIEARNVPLDYIKSQPQWANKVHLIPPGVWDGTLTTMPHTGSSSTRDPWGKYEAFTTSSGAVTTFTSGYSPAKTRDLVTLIEVCIPEDDGTMQYFPCANGVMLQDMDEEGKSLSPYDDDKYPYSLYNLIRNKDSAYGHSGVGFFKKLQMELNEIHSYLMDQQKYESDSPLIVDQENIEEGQLITNQSGSIYINNSQRGQGYYLMQKPGANPKWMDLEEIAIRRVKEITGSVDILRGERLPGVTTLGAMEIIRDEANVLVRKMTLQLLNGLKHKDLLVLSRLKQFLKDEREVRVKGKRNQTEYITVNRRTKMGLTGDWERDNTIPDDFEADFDFTPMPPGGSAARFERAMTLISAPGEDGKPIVDRQWVLESIEEDQERIDQLMERIGEKQAQEAQLVAQSQTQSSLQGRQGQPMGVAPQAPPSPQGDASRIMERAMEILG